VGTCHCYQKCVSIDCNDVPRTAQLLLFRVLIPFFVDAFLTCADDREHFSLMQIDLSHCMVLGVAEIDEVLFVAVDVAGALRVVETGVFERAVDQTYLARCRANHINAIEGLRVNNHKSVVAGVRNDEQRVGNTILSLDAHHFSRKFEVL